MLLARKGALGKAATKNLPRIIGPSSPPPETGHTLFSVWASAFSHWPHWPKSHSACKGSPQPPQLPGGCIVALKLEEFKEPLAWDEPHCLPSWAPKLTSCPCPFALPLPYGLSRKSFLWGPEVTGAEEGAKAPPGSQLGD